MNSTNVRMKKPDKTDVAYRPTANPWLSRVSKLTPELAGWLGLHWFTQPRHWPRPEREQALLARGEPLSLARGEKAWSFGQGAAVILVHGWEGRGTQLGSFVAPLVAKGFRVLLFDAQPTEARQVSMPL